MPQKIAYGTGQIAGSLSSEIGNQLVRPVFVLNPAIGFSPATIGFCEAIYRMWDAVTDVWMGSVSDNTRTRWGRRRPYIFIGSVLLGFVVPAMFMFDQGWSTQAILFWMVGFQLLLFTCQTIFNVPWQSLQLELTPNSAERTSVSSYRSALGSVVGLVAPWLWAIIQLPVFNNAAGQTDVVRGAFWVALVAGVLIIAAGLVPAIFCREPYYKSIVNQTKVSVLTDLKLTFKNTVFLRIMLITLLMIVSGSTVDGLNFFTRLYYVFEGDTVAAARFAGIAGNVATISGLAAIPLYNYLARRFGKRATLLGSAIVMTVAALSTWVFYVPENPYLMLINVVLGVPPVVGYWVLFPSMLGDAADHDELTTHKRREGSFSAIYSWSVKVALTIGGALSGLVVVWAGFASGSAVLIQSPETITNMRLLLALLPIGILGAAIWCIAGYPLTNTRMLEIRAELEARRGRL